MRSPRALDLDARKSAIVRSASIVGVVMISAVFWHLAGREDPSKTSNVAPTLASGPVTLPHDSVASHFKRIALNALLLPLLDEDAPERWADPSYVVDCADARVTIDGGRLDVGSPVPRSFRVRWYMDQCAPLGDVWELSGVVELRVESDDHGYRAHVKPKELSVTSARGGETLTDPFMAYLAIDTSAQSITKLTPPSMRHR
jgi:hypothetical protein